MPDIIVTLSKWWKTIAAIALSATLLALLITLLLPKQYLSVATALPANSAASDKASIFNNNIQALYSSLGTPDELDRVIGTAHLDTLFIAVAAKFNLQQHYGIANNGQALYKAADKLKDNSKIYKSEYDDLKIKVWDKDKNMAAQLANALMETLQQINQQLQNEGNIRTLQKLKGDYTLLQQQYGQTSGSGNTDKDSNGLLQIKRAAQIQQLTEYEKLIAQYEVMVNANIPVLLVAENARPAVFADKPYIWQSVVAVFFAAFLFSVLLAFYVEGKTA